MITLVEIGKTSQDCLQKVETEKKREYDVLANKFCMIYKAKTKITAYVMTWDKVFTK